VHTRGVSRNFLRGGGPLFGEKPQQNEEIFFRGRGGVDQQPPPLNTPLVHTPY